MAELVGYRVDRGVAVLSMDDGKANALSPAMLEALENALARAEAESLGVVLAGREGKFCAGFDLKVMMSSPAAARDLVLRGAELFLRLYAYGRPVVAACSGHAIAGGALLLLSCDTRVAAAGAFQIGLNEVAIGMTLPAFAMELARGRLAVPALTAATVEAQLFAPDAAAHVGYVDRVVPAAEVLDAAVAECVRLAALPAVAFAGTKRRMREGHIAVMRAALGRDREEMTAMTGG